MNMSKISDIIFNGEPHRMSSPFGRRTVITTSAGKTSNYHQGTDYATYDKRIPQYAIETGYCFASSKAQDGANYVWIIYPRIKKAMLHYHLDRRVVGSGEKVSKGTLIGYTGRTGKATGIHLHLGIRDISKLSEYQVKHMTWDLLRTCSYIDPEIYAKKYILPNGNPYAKPQYVVNRKKYEYGRIKTGRDAVRWVQYQLQNKGFYKGHIDGFFGPETETAVKAFQKQNGLEVDGSVGPKTREALAK